MTQPQPAPLPKTKEYPNFYENLKEASMRLRNTVVLYEGDPYYVLAVTDHKKDTILRIYMDPLGDPNGFYRHPNRFSLGDYNYESPELGIALDTFLKAYPTTSMVRKYVSAPGFNKFRPFPLGMCHVGNGLYYFERTPSRKSEQGLTKSSIMAFEIEATGEARNRRPPGLPVEMHGPELALCIAGNYPSIESCYADLQDPSVTNTALAFHRDLAFVRGPCESTFLAYKKDVVAVVTSPREFKLGKSFEYLQDTLASLPFFN